MLQGVIGIQTPKYNGDLPRRVQHTQLVKQTWTKNCTIVTDIPNNLHEIMFPYQTIFLTNFDHISFVHC